MEKGEYRTVLICMVHYPFTDSHTQLKIIRKTKKDRPTVTIMVVMMVVMMMIVVVVDDGDGS